MPLWHLSASQAGLMASAFALGYMVAVPFLAALTDRIDARWVLLAGSAISGLATIAFGLLADGLLSASIIWAIAGAGFGGAYMPGLKAMVDRLPPGDTSRSVTLYTSCFSVGVGLSFLISQLAANSYGWRAAFLITGLAPLAMVAVALMLNAFKPVPSTSSPFDYLPVFRNRAALGYILGYGSHCFELYGMRTWIVAFWTFVVASHPTLLTPLIVSFVFSILAMPASILGNELALKLGRHRAISAVMVTSAAVALLIGGLSDQSPWVLIPLLLVYALTVPADSGALTSGMTMAADPANKGATMAMHSTVGFSLSALGAWAVGVALDAAGGPASASAWTAAFAVLAFGILLGPLALSWSRRASLPAGPEA